MKRDGRCAEKRHTFEVRRLPPADLGDGRDDHASKLPLTVWFWAGYLMATHSNGISAVQLQKQLGIGSYRSAWLLAHKLRASMVDPERNPLSGLEGNRRGQPSIPDERPILPPEGKDAATTARCSSSAPSNSGTETSQAASAGRNLLLRRRRPRTLRRNRRRSRRHRENRRLVRLRCGPRRSPQCPCRREDRRSPRPAVDPPNLLQPQRMGARRLPRAASQDLQAYLDEFVFRFNRRKTRHAAFRSLFRLATNAEPLTYSMLIEPEPCA